MLRMSRLIFQPLCRILPIQQIEDGVQLTFAHFEVVVPNVIDQLRQVRFLRQLIPGDNETKPRLGARNRHIQQVRVVRKIRRRIVHHTHDDRVALSPLVLVHRTGQILPHSAVDCLR